MRFGEALGVLCVCVFAAFVLGLYFGLCAGMGCSDAELIKRGYKAYHPTTGKLVWKDEVKKPLPTNPVAGCEVRIDRDGDLVVTRDRSVFYLTNLGQLPPGFMQYLKACLERGNE